MFVAPALASATGGRPTVGSILAANDPGSTRLVYAMVVGLVLIGVALVVLGVWLVRQTRYDPPVLAPLERMGDGSWRKRDPATQRRILDEVRPEGAQPIEVGIQPPSLDAEFDDDRRPVRELDDLGPGVAPESTKLPTPDVSQRLTESADAAAESTEDAPDVSAAAELADGSAEVTPEHDEESAVTEPDTGDADVVPDAHPEREAEPPGRDSTG